jgi:methylisocitrate lyase
LAQGPAVAPSCFDALSARLAEYVGFSALHVTGSGVASALLGAPDMGLTTLTEMTTLVAHVAEAVSIPMICDVDTGFGGTHNVQRTIREMIRAGAAGVHIEDQLNPKRSPFVDRIILDRDAAVARVKAALDARTDPDFLIVARSDADAISFEELIERCNLYLAAGAEMVFPMVAVYGGIRFVEHSPEKQLEIIRTLVQEINGAIMGMAIPKPGMMTVPDFVDAGAAMVIVPNIAVTAASTSMLLVLREVFETGTAASYFERNPEDPDVRDGGLYNVLGLSRYLEADATYGL